MVEGLLVAEPKGVEGRWEIMKFWIKPTALGCILCSLTKCAPRHRQIWWWWTDEASKVVDQKRCCLGKWKRTNAIGLYHENAIAIESEARNPNGGNVYYVTMQITFHIPEFACKECNLYCDIVYTLPPFGSLDSFWITRSQLCRRHDKGLRKGDTCSCEGCVVGTRSQKEPVCEEELMSEGEVFRITMHIVKVAQAV